MTYTYTFTQTDYVAFSLHNASRKKSVKKQLTGSWAWGTLVFMLISIMYYLGGYTDLAIVFFIVAILAFILYPAYLKRRYISHYTKHATEIFKDKESTLVKTEINSEDIITSNEKGEFKIHLTAIENIAETGQHLFVYVGGGQGLIIPKTAVDFEMIKSDLKNATEKLNIPYQTDLNWRWK